MAAEEPLQETAARIKACALDSAALAAIDAQLAARLEPKARTLRIKIASLQRAIRLAQNAPASTASQRARSPSF